MRWYEMMFQYVSGGLVFFTWFRSTFELIALEKLIMNWNKYMHYICLRRL